MTGERGLVVMDFSVTEIKYNIHCQWGLESCLILLGFNVYRVIKSISGFIRVDVD